jgi:hypothetical protein
VRRFSFVKPFLTVHDEVVMMLPESKVDEYRSQIEAEARKVPLWATGLPLDLGSFVAKRFRKD